MSRNLCHLTIAALVLAMSIASTGRTDTQNVQEGPALSSPEISIYGFGDVVVDARDERSDRTVQLGQVEFGFDAAVAENTSLSLAVALEDDTFVPSVLTIQHDWEVIGPFSYLSVGGGRFDVPFGIDWQVYSSIDRVTITEPLAVVEIHDAWNSLGAYATAHLGPARATVFSVNQVTGHPGEDPSEEQTEWEDAFVIGGRVAVEPINSVTTGVSFAHADPRSIDHIQFMVGADFEWSAPYFRVRGEYLHQEIFYPVGADLTRRGFYLENQLFVDRYHAVVRIGDLGEHGPFSTYVSELTAALGVNLQESVILRGEYRTDFEFDRSEPRFQLVAGF